MAASCLGFQFQIFIFHFVSVRPSIKREVTVSQSLRSTDATESWMRDKKARDVGGKSHQLSVLPVCASRVEGDQSYTTLTHFQSVEQGALCHLQRTRDVGEALDSKVVLVVFQKERQAKMVTPVKFCSLIILVLLASVCIIAAKAMSSNKADLGRRSFVVSATQVGIAASAGMFTGPPVSFASDSTGIADRLEKQDLSLPKPSQASELTGIDNMYFPSFLAGEWSMTQTLVDFSTPLGLKFVGGPNGSESIATDTITETKKQLNKPVSLRLRYLPTKWGVAEDRLFNTRERLNAFAGKSVVASVEYANVGGSNRASVLAMGGTEQDPLQTTLVRFKGPAAQKTFLLSHGSQSLSDAKWVGYEVDRSIFALTNQNTAPPVTTDTELIWMLEQTSSSGDMVKGKLRIASYLNAQRDKLYFEARNRAVSLQDYTLEMKRVQEP